MKDVIKIKKPNQVSNVKVSHEASSFYADLSKQWAIKLDKPIENGEYSSKYYAKISEQYANSANKSAMSAEVAASNLEKFVINSLYFPELKISNEDTILNNLEREKRSTFDKSKFTVVGSPTITDDGVASRFVAQSSYIKTALTIDFTSAQSFEIAFSITTPIAPAEQPYTGVLSASDLGNNEYIVVGYELQNNRFVYGVGSPTGTFWNVNSSSSVKPNTKYHIKIKVNNTTVVIQKSTDNINWETDASGSLNSSLNLNSSLFFGVDRGKIRPFKGSIDLSQFSITVDGKEVFSGNKTGIDTIKADNYEVVGSPTISDDGVITTSVGINTYKDSVRSQSITLSNSEKFCIFCKLPKRAIGDIYGVLRLQQTGTTDNNNYNFNLEARRDIGSSGVGYRFVYFVTENNVRSVKTLDFQIPEILNQDVSVKIEYSAEQNTIRIYKYINNQEILITSRTLTAPLSYIDEYGYLHIGMTQGYSINLNSFKIYVDGNLVYQPCLKIPYTQSKTGSKIVDGVYRDRVWDMYNQFGYTHYYTLGDTDFTLATCKGSDIIESGENYEQTADLTLKQWGSATSGQTVNLLPYKDTNYAVTLVNGSKTKSSVVANAAGDYIAVGKTVLG